MLIRTLALVMWVGSLLVSPSAMAGEKILRILSYNIHGLPSLLAANNNDRFAMIGKILAKRAAEGTGPDLVLLQEAFDGDTDEVLEQSQYPYIKKGPGGSFLHLGSGLVILSAHPILETHASVYKNCASWDCFSRKGVQMIRLKIEGISVPVDIYNTHLNSDPDSDPFTSKKTTMKVRIKQINHLVSFMQKYSSGSIAISAGDYNFIYQQKDYQHFASLASALDSAVDCGSDLGCSGRESVAADLQSSVDHEFLVGGKSGRVAGIMIEPIEFERNFQELVEGERLSDHDGLEIQYRLSF